MIKSIYHDTAVAVEVTKVDADNEVVTGAGVDMSGFEGVAFIAVVGKGEVAAHSLKAQQDTDSAFGTAADLAGTAKAFSSAVAADARGGPARYSAVPAGDSLSGVSVTPQAAARAWS